MARSPAPALLHSSRGGEPPSGSVDPLAVRGGPLRVMPLHNGPLQLQGPLELCAGTRRTVARVTEARLCRCGQSRNKPFCDLSHVAAGFVADGARAARWAPWPLHQVVDEPSKKLSLGLAVTPPGA